MEVSWTDFKAFVVSKSLSIQWVSAGSNYWLKACDGYFTLECFISNDSFVSPDALDFETNFKSLGNVRPSQFVSVQSAPAFGEKSAIIGGVLKKFYARNTGLQYVVSPGSNLLTYTATYPWAKMIGVECINALPLDTAELRVYDNPSGTYSGVPNALLNQFGYTLNMGPDFYVRFSPFDADLYASMVIKITYVSVGVADRTVGVNFIMNEVKS